jgi:hypothetical protein
MSGGSFDYLCFKDIEFPHGTLEDMARELDALGPSKAASDTRALIASLAECQALVERLRDVWQDVEWWRSGDSGQDRALEGVSRYEANAPREVKRTHAGATCSQFCTATEATCPV